MMLPYLNVAIAIVLVVLSFGLMWCAGSIDGGRKPVGGGCCGRNCCCVPAMIVLVCAGLLLANSVHAADHQRVTDQAGVLKAQTITQINAISQSCEQRTGAQVVLVTVPTLNGDTIDEFAQRLATSWGIGQKGKNNGVLIVMAKAEHKVRIHVGYGLESVLPDGKTKRILMNNRGALSQGNFDVGLTGIVVEVTQSIR